MKTIKKGTLFKDRERMVSAPGMSAEQLEDIPFESATDLENLYDNFQDDIEHAWEEHLSYMQDSLEHKNLVAKSDKIFWEWLGENYETILNKSFK